MNYTEFIDTKRQSESSGGFAPVWLPDSLFDFQSDLVEWALGIGRAAIFADCGLGKTLIQLVWSENVARHTGGRVLVLTPLAVGPQTVREGDKFGIDAVKSSGELHRITVTNYEKLGHFSPDNFAGVVCDESSILKSFGGVRRKEITQFMRKVEYRLLCTATAAPNDFVELGTSSEALGYLGHVDMLGRFFKNDLGNSTGQGRAYGNVMKWRFKGHAETPFWRWVRSWARAVRRPSDLGRDDSRFILPTLTEIEHVVTTNSAPPGFLFPVTAMDLNAQREERRRTIPERCERVAELVHHDRQALVWCHLNKEGDSLTSMIPGAVQVSGTDTDEQKEAAFCGFSDGSIRVLVTKPSIGAWGLNFQNCNHVSFFPSHSFEQYYQGVRRCWRFGQENPVTVDVVTTEGELGVLANLQRKAKQSEVMFSELVRLMHDTMSISRVDNYEQKTEVPQWLSPTSV